MKKIHFQQQTGLLGEDETSTHEQSFVFSQDIYRKHMCIRIHQGTDVKKRVCKVPVASERHFKLF